MGKPSNKLSEGLKTAAVRVIVGNAQWSPTEEDVEKIRACLGELREWLLTQTAQPDIIIAHEGYLEMEIHPDVEDPNIPWREVN